jgi:hypothetical protein
MAVLDIVLILFLRKKITGERRFAEESERLSAEVQSVTASGTDVHKASYNITVRADNGCIYRVWSGSSAALTMKPGDTVEILVPEGAVPLMQEDEHFEEICRRGKDAV